MDQNIEANFSTLILSIAHSAKVAMGEVEHPETKQQMKDLKMAQFNIDLISTLKKKTEGNLDGQEKQLIKAILGDLQMRFVQNSSTTPAN